ncbi:MAG: GDSL-type esterase/lipase family protein [Lachnospiraceae bacterium]
MRIRRNTFNLILLTVCLVMILGFMGKQIIKSGILSDKKIIENENPAETSAPDVSEPPSDTEPEQSLPTDSKNQASSDTAYTFSNCDKSYFDDALFIGDSRTIGLSEYGFLNTADYFAVSGMNLYSLDKETITIDGTEYSFSQLLEAKDYKKIYLMLGINELGYDFDQTLKKYTALVDTLKASEPDAVIYVCANLHVTKTRSDENKIYNNQNIDRFNAKVAELADDHTIFYLDVNELFDDEEGNLKQEYTYDNAHVLGKYYVTWCEWLCTKAIVK